ncbi:acyl-CoA thioesterase [Sphingobium lignivorans]|uniref:Acyl-CoA thioester hydrolase n=1 Tax=Sphingobium lignivorans TaxID=2735886 RepID=A0ABR6N9U6_9SPHN|nr:acyl-CoA thioesterase [Sphingobium lignivorans]MBB5984042.1 acyl-CoA thioester hydrolase [Sphingobium lignivorans]
MSTAFRMTFVAQPEDIDVMGHVNNAVWVRWMEIVATHHWEALAPMDVQQRVAWVVTRHEIDYRGNVRQGETVEAVTQIDGPPRGARFDRVTEFFGTDGKLRVTARTTWAMIDLASGRLMRVPADLAEIFLA